MAEQVEGPDGRSWVVMRRWVPRLPGETLWGRFRRRFGRSSRRMRDWDGVADVADIASSGGGDGITGVLAMIGLAIALIRQEPLATRVDALSRIPRAVADLRASGFIDLAIIAIVVTPVAAVVTIFRGFTIRGDLRFAAYTLAVLVVLAASITLAVVR